MRNTPLIGFAALAGLLAIEPLSTKHQTSRNDYHVPKSKREHTPHQGKREMERRAKKLLKAGKP